jgi:hypothetical protein
MKKFLSILLILSTTLFADQYEIQSLISGDISHGGYGGPVLKFTEMNNSYSVLIGGRGGWIINDQFVIGGGGYGLSNDIPVNLGTTKERYLNFGYAGLELGYILASNSILHIDFNALFGAGGVGYRNSVFDDDDDWDDCGSYRHVVGIRDMAVSNKDLTGASASFTLKFGSF